MHKKDVIVLLMMNTYNMYNKIRSNVNKTLIKELNTRDDACLVHVLNLRQKLCPSRHMAAHNQLKRPDIRCAVGRRYLEDVNTRSLLGSERLHGLIVGGKVRATSRLEDEKRDHLHVVTVGKKAPDL